MLLAVAVAEFEATIAVEEIKAEAVAIVVVVRRVTHVDQYATVELLGNERLDLLIIGQGVTEQLLLIEGRRSRPGKARDLSD